MNKQTMIPINIKQNHKMKYLEIKNRRTNNMEDLVYTVKETSKLLKTDEPTVRKLIDKGFLRALKLGRLKVRKVEI
jgi:excisionase family DNA binding protein